MVVVAFIAYNLFGDQLEGTLRHGEISLNHFLDINIYTSDGLFGVPIRVAATYAFLFVLFGTALSKVGGAEFFFNLAAAVSGGANNIGIGVSLAAVTQQFSQGSISSTDNPLDLAINGGGFFQLKDLNGSLQYSRNGQLQVHDFVRRVNSP